MILKLFVVYDTANDFRDDTCRYMYHRFHSLCSVFNNLFFQITDLDPTELAMEDLDLDKSLS